MAIARVQKVAFKAEGDASVTVTFGSPPTEGNLLIAWTMGETVATNASITGWTKAISCLVGGSASSAIFYKVAGAGESSNVTINWTSSTSTAIAVAEYSGLSAVVLDKTAYSNNDGSPGTSQTSGTTATTTASEELAVVMVQNRNGITSPSWSNSFTTLDVDGSPTYVINGQKFLSATGEIETTLSWTGDAYSGGCIATFKATPAGNPHYAYVQQ